MSADDIRNVFSREVSFMSDDPHLVSLLKRMLHPNPNQRLGGGAEDGIEILKDGDFHRYNGRNPDCVWSSVGVVRAVIRHGSFPALHELLS